MAWTQHGRTRQATARVQAIADSVIRQQPWLDHDKRVTATRRAAAEPTSTGAVRVSVRVHLEHWDDQRRNGRDREWEYGLLLIIRDELADYRMASRPVMSGWRTVAFDVDPTV